MKITKYPQSCLLVEHNGKRIVIDPGSFVPQKYKIEDFLPVDGVLITHEHQDHADPSFIKRLVGSDKTPVIGNQSTSDAFPGLITKVVKDKDEFEVAGIKISAHELPHVVMIDGSPGPQNTGFVIDGFFFDPGDGVEIDGLTVQTAAVPIAGPDISPHDVYKFIKSIGCHTAIPVHYDYFLADPKLLTHIPDVKIVILANGESTELA